MSTPVTDDAAKVLAEPEGLRRRGSPARGAGTSARRTRRWHWSTVRRLPTRSGRSPSTPTSWTSSAPTTCSSTRRGPLLADRRDRRAVSGQARQAAVGLRTLIHMDDPQHRDVAQVGADWFRPKAMRALEDPRRRAGQALRRQDGGASGPECDFVQRGRGQLPAVRDPVAARAARVGLRPDAQADPGDVRRRRRRVQRAARRPEELHGVLLDFFPTSPS